MCQKQYYKNPSPCLTCTRVPDPRECENKQCKLWQRWFVDRWEQLRSGVRHQVQTREPEAAGVNIGGVRYAMPHQVEDYLKKDPCAGCLCGDGLCVTPCRAKRSWEETRKDVFL